MDYRLVEYTTDRGLVLEDKEIKYYFQKFSEEKDFNIEMKGPLPTSFSELTITTFSKTYDSYDRAYKKAPQILAEVGGVINSMYLIAIVFNFYTEKKLKEADIFNMCVHKTHDQNINIDEKECESNRKLTIDKRVKFVNNSSNSSKKNKDLNENCELNLGPESGENSRKIIMNVESKKENKNNLIFDNSSEKASTKSIIRFKSIIFEDEYSLDQLLKVNYSFLEMICPFMRKPIHSEKMDLAEKFCDQLFDIKFIFGNVLDTQVILNNMFEKKT